MQILTTMLELTGELGYRRAMSRSVGLSEPDQRELERHFDSREACFLAAYEAEAECLFEALIAAAARESSWREAVQAALIELLRFTTRRTKLARAVFNEVYVAGGAALTKHEELLDHIARILEYPCSQHLRSSTSPASLFLVGALEHLVRSQLTHHDDPDEIWASFPELMHLVVSPYLGHEAAAEELRRPPPNH